MSDYIPQELLIEILTRLPVKSLVRFTLVCKTWYNIITNPNFIKIHLNQTITSYKNNNPKLLLRYYDINDWKEHYTLRSDDETFGVEFSELELEFKSSIGYFRIVGSCNGLVCLSDDLFGNMETIILWNPSIRKSLILPEPRTPKFPHMFVLGFGVDPKTQDFKVVRIVYYKDYSYGFKLPPEVEVYMLSTGSWRMVYSAPPPQCYMVEFMWSEAFLNGAVHWIAYDERQDDAFRSFIVSFDMGDEAFREIMLPDALAGELVTNLFVTVFGESLAVLKYNKQTETTSCCVWVMKEYGVVESWTRLFTVDIGGTLEKIVGFRNNNEVFLSPGSNKLVSYDHKINQIKDLGILGSTRSFYIDTYMETIALLKGHNGAFDGQLTSCDASTFQRGEAKEVQK